MKNPIKSMSYDKFQIDVRHFPDKNHRVIATRFDSIGRISPCDIEFGNKKVISGTTPRAKARTQEGKNKRKTERQVRARVSPGGIKS